MSQTLPDLVVSPCPIREHTAALTLRSNILFSLSSSEGFSWHPTLFGTAVIYWRRYSDFDANPGSGELRACETASLGTEDGFNLENLDWICDRLPQIPRGAGSFRAIIEDKSIPVDVRTLENGVYFRLHDHLDMDFDVRRVAAGFWAPEGMERWSQPEGEEFIHFRPKNRPKPKRRLWRVLVHGWEGARED